MISTELVEYVINELESFEATEERLLRSRSPVVSAQDVRPNESLCRASSDNWQNCDVPAS